MQRRNLGQQGLVSSAIGLGTMGMTMAYGAGDEPGGIATIQRAHELGVSESGPEVIRRAHAVQPVSVLQTEYSIFERAVETEIIPAIRELEIGFVAYSPLGRGFLTSAVKPAADYPADDMRSWDERWQPGNYEKNVQAIRELTELAEAKGTGVTQLALAWLLAQGDDIVPIPGTRNPAREAENVAAADVRLTDDDLARVNDILPDGAFGSRYPAAMMPQW